MRNLTRIMTHEGTKMKETKQLLRFTANFPSKTGGWKCKNTPSRNLKDCCSKCVYPPMEYNVGEKADIQQIFGQKCWKSEFSIENLQTNLKIVLKLFQNFLIFRSNWQNFIEFLHFPCLMEDHQHMLLSSNSSTYYCLFSAKFTKNLIIIPEVSYLLLINLRISLL